MFRATIIYCSIILLSTNILARPLLLDSTKRKRRRRPEPVEANLAFKSSGCVDVVSYEWTNANNLSCADFTSDSSLCTLDGNEYSLQDGRTATAACCACGGGVLLEQVLVSEVELESSNSNSTSELEDLSCISRYNWRFTKDVTKGTNPKDSLFTNGDGLSIDESEILVDFGCHNISSDPNEQLSCARYEKLWDFDIMDKAEDAVSWDPLRVTHQKYGYL